MTLPVKGQGGRKPPPLPRNADAEDEEDLDDLVVRPPPPPAEGAFRARVARLQVFNGNGPDAKKTRAIIFAINDPKEQERLNRNEPSQQGKELVFRLQFDGNFYRQTMQVLAALGFPYDSWPEGQGNARVLPWAKMKEALTPAEVSKTPHFTITIKATEGKKDLRLPRRGSHR